ncbi:16S rRNA (cytidine(1402)-2'-O)-methyltransferase [bacterium]|nr:16S rRNA (cytidine(1402)-2'-O)-methyltransferase [bacterium]
MESLEEKGTLYIVSTPIGNLKDITFRAIEVLGSVSLVAAEDTRRTYNLLRHYTIQVPATSYHDHNKEKKTPQLIKQLLDGKSIAMVSDAGTPGISDPCFFLIRAAIQNDIEVTTLPGPTAFVPALLLSGLPLHRFAFEGFLPVKKGRQTRLTALANEDRTMIFYESPYRIAKTLKDLEKYFGSERQAAICKELTKIHETVLRGSLSELQEGLKTITNKGEWVIVISGMETTSRTEMAS